MAAKFEDYDWKLSTYIFYIFFLCNFIAFAMMVLISWFVWLMIHLYKYIQELPEEAKEAATKLGYTKKMWDSDKGK